MSFLAEVSKAIRDNGLIQIRNAYTRTEMDPESPDYGKVIGACALGQAAENLYMRPIDIRFSLMSFDRVDCPVDDDCGKDYTVDVMVTHLNDIHFWTFVQIADFLDGLEK